MAGFNAFQMPDLNKNDQGGLRFDGSQVGWQDNASGVAGGGSWNTPKVQGTLTRDQNRYNTGMVLEGQQMGFDGLANQMSDGFNKMPEMMQYGGLFGSNNYSPQSGNGYGQNNPFGNSTF